MYAFLKKHTEEQKRIQYFKKQSNNIHADDVDIKAVKGHNITILKGSYVCENSSIDSYTYIGFNTLISKTIIGRYNSIANNVNIGHGEHPLNLISTSSFLNDTPYEVLTQKQCIVTHDVWIGSGATIRRGITLGIGCVVGGNAFVNKDVPPFAVVGGVPAKILKYRFPQEKIDKILASSWWEKDVEQAKIIVKKLEEDN
ncbi:CatB-related O-acetyltransferase [Mucilaginibacter sp.]|uniref:CatB-related O-acetyltransferase n=1 Tax=Mucilaginibacter sp. TaxID=1882438 RepID=UPI0025E7CCAA|nr:CatB-related O-acetyltransferase [Mucilaginibacter sp.]